MRKGLLSCSIILGLMLMLGAPTASADQISFGGNSTGSVGVTCVAETSCSMSVVGGTLSSAGTAQFESPTGVSISSGGYSLTFSDVSTLTFVGSGGPGAVNFSVSGNPWVFTFSDSAGDSITGNVNWLTFDNASTLGYNVMGGIFTTTSITGVSANFSSDFLKNGIIDMSFDPKSVQTDLLTLYQTGGSDSGMTVSGGEIVPNTAVPEPGTLALFGSGLIGIASFVRRKITRS